MVEEEEDDNVDGEGAEAAAIAIDYNKAEIVLLREVSDQSKRGPLTPLLGIGKSIRTQGQCTTLHTATRFCAIEHDGSRLWVDLSLVGFGVARLERFCQFIGELKDSAGLAVSLRNCIFF